MLNEVKHLSEVQYCSSRCFASLNMTMKFKRPLSLNLEPWCLGGKGSCRPKLALEAQA